LAKDIGIIMKKSLARLQTFPLWFLALPAYAQKCPAVLCDLPFTGQQGLLGFIQGIASLVAYAFVAIAIILFLYTAFLFLTASGNEERQKKAKQTLLWALIGVAIALFSFGIFAFIRGFLTERIG